MQPELYYLNNSHKKILNGRYGALVSIPDEPDKTGYSFSSWGEAVPKSFGIENITFSATSGPVGLIDTVATNIEKVTNIDALSREK